MYRLRGELLLLGERADEPAAHEALRRGLTLARSVEAGSIEVRAATSWSRLLRRAGRADEARALGGGRDAHDTADLREARAPRRAPPAGAG